MTLFRSSRVFLLCFLGPSRHIIIFIQFPCSCREFHGEESGLAINGPAPVIRIPGNVNQIPTLHDLVFFPQDVVQLAIQNERELLFIRMHVQGGGPSPSGFVTMPTFMNSPVTLLALTLGFVLLLLSFILSIS